MEKEKDWTVLKLLQWTSEYLDSRGFESPRTTAELLLGHVLACNRLDLYLKFDKPVFPPELTKFREAIKRRLKNEPVQYIIGETEFYSLKFVVDCSVLIPRPETEILVEKAICHCKERWSAEQSITVLDVGTGSGNISISLAKNLPNAGIEAMDISGSALATARRNAELNGMLNKIRFHHLSIFDAGQAQFKDLHGIVSNPPYVSRQDYAELPEEIRSFEPETALADGRDGLTFYPRLCSCSMEWLGSGGFLMVETGMGGAPKVASFFEEYGYKNIERIRDLNDIERIVCGWKP